MEVKLALTEEQSKELQQSIYQYVREGVEKARRDSYLDRDLLSQKEMSKHLGVSINTLKLYETLGLHSHKVGGRVYYSKKETEEFIKSY